MLDGLNVDFLSSPVDVGEFWLTMRHEGLLPTVFYDGEPPSLSEFIDRHPCFFGLWLFGEPVGCFWLTHIEGHMARLHFCMFKASRGRTVQIGEAAIAWMGKTFPWLRVLWGLTPANNLLAVRFVKRVGFELLGTIPNACFAGGQYVGGVVSHYAIQEV